jgi:hypothetical protein
MKRYVILAMSTNAEIVVQFSQAASPVNHSGRASVGSIGNLPWKTSISILKYNSKYDILNSVT